MNYIDYHKYDKAIVLFSGTWREMKLSNKQRLIDKLRKNKSLKNNRIV